MRAWLLYSLVRIGIFAAVFALLYVLLGPTLWWVAAIFAAVIALCISYIALGGLRGRVTGELAERAQARRSRTASTEDPDAAIEDGIADSGR